MRGTSSFPESIVEQRGMAVMNDEEALMALARDLVAKNPKQAESYRAGKVNLLGFFIGQIMKLTGGAAEPALVNRVLKRALVGDPESSPLPSSVGELSTDLPTREPRSPSPLAESVAPPPPAHRAAQERTLTSAAIELSGFLLPVASELLSRDAFGKVDLRVGRVARAARVPQYETLLELLVDVGEERPRRVVQALALSFAPEELVDQRVVVVCNLEPHVEGEGLVSDALILVAGPAAGLALATVVEHVRPGTPFR